MALGSGILRCSPGCAAVLWLMNGALETGKYVLQYGKNLRYKFDVLPTQFCVCYFAHLFIIVLIGVFKGGRGMSEEMNSTLSIVAFMVQITETAANA